MRNTKSGKQGSVNSPRNLFKGAKRFGKVIPIDTERMLTTIYRTSFGALLISDAICDVSRCALRESPAERSDLLRQSNQPSEGVIMSANSIGSSPALSQLNAALSGEVAKNNVAYAVAAKSASVNKEVAQATVDLLKDAANISSGNTAGRGIDLRA